MVADRHPGPDCMDDNALTIDFVGERRHLAPGEELTFGRAADLVIDDGNQYLHRRLGRFLHHDGNWWVENLGSQIELEVVGGAGTVLSLPPQDPGGTPSAAPLSGGDAPVRFAVAGARYELSVSVPAPPPPARPDPPHDGAATLGYGRIDLTEEERLLLLSLADPVLRDVSAGPDTIPTNREAARRLGWTQPKFNRKLDYLCIRLTKAGVKGLQGGRGDEALNRRWRLVEHAVGTRLVTPSELTGLPD